MNEHDQELVELLQRDARRIREGEQFDAKLHRDTMRAIRQTEPGPAREAWWSPRRLALAGTAVTAVTVCVLLVLALQPPSGPPSAAAPRVATTAPPTSALAYRSALAAGEDALMAMLDRDARVLLPRTVDVFEPVHR